MHPGRKVAGVAEALKGQTKRNLSGTKVPVGTSKPQIRTHTNPPAKKQNVRNSTI